MSLEKGLIALSGCLRGEIPKALQMHDEEKAVALVAEYQEIFGKENFFSNLSIIRKPPRKTK